MNATWHLDPDGVERYRAGLVDQVTAASVDAHVLRCAACRRLFAEPAAAHRRRWVEIVDVLDRPPVRRVERVLRALGVPTETTRLVVGTPPLVGAWLGTVVAALAFSLLAAHAGTGRVGVLAFLVVAPLVPVAGTALAYAPQFEPPGALAVATPARDLRLLLVRTAFVLGLALPATFAVGVALPGPRSFGVMWLLPALALTGATLAASAWFDVRRCAAAAAAAWSALVLLPAAGLRHRSLADLHDHVVPARPAVQLACLVASALAVAVVVVQRGRGTVGRTW